MILCADTTQVLACFPDECIHLTFTSPPYFNARPYAQYVDYDAYLDTMTAVFAQVHRMTKEGRYLVVNTSPVLTPRQKRSDQSHRHAIPFDLHTRLTAQGWEFIDDIIWAKPEASAKHRNGGFWQHRKPLAYKPNVVIEYVMAYRKKTDKLLDWNLRGYSKKEINESLVLGEYPTSNLWTISPSPSRKHPATFPLQLAELVVRLYSIKGDVVMDPFAGSGTVGAAALSLERHPILIDADLDYCRLAQERLKPYSG